MEIPESPLFSGLQPLDIRYFNNSKKEYPAVNDGAYQINRVDGVSALASSVKIHGYLNGDLQQRSATLNKIKGFPVVEVREGKGLAVLSTIELDKGAADPVAAKLLSGIMSALSEAGR